MSRLKHKRGRKSNYVKTLQNNDYWEKVKRKVRIRDGFACKVCGSTIKLETHHITYMINGQSIIGKELEHLQCIVTLCEKDHQAAHSDRNHIYNPSNRMKKLIW